MNAPVVYHVPRPRLLLVHDARKVAGASESWRDVHRRMSQLGKHRAAHERELCRGLLEAERLAVHARLGYASLKEYAERVVGLSARQCEERLRVGRALEQLSELDRALASGELCWSVVRELTRIATGENEAAWLEWAQGRRAGEVAMAVAERKAGAEPESPADPGLVRHRLRFDVSAETMALFRELQAAVRRELGAGEAPGDSAASRGHGSSGDTIDDDTLLFEIARRALAGDVPSGESNSDLVLVPPGEVGSSQPNSQPAGADPPPREGNRGQPNGERAVAHEPEREGSRDQPKSQRMGAQESAHQGATTVDAGRPHYQVAVTRCPRCAETSIDAGGRRHRLDPEVAEMIDCDAQIIGAVDQVGAEISQTQPQSPPRATQTIPPATRRAVIRRHHGRCAVPGCRHHQFLDIHHVKPRAEGGSHNQDQLVVLCGAHHRAHHQGHLRVTGSARAGFRFSHADGTPYGKSVEPTRHEVARRVLLALTSLGFRRKEAEQRLRIVQQDGPRSSHGDFESLLRATLAA